MKYDLTKEEIDKKCETLLVNLQNGSPDPIFKVIPFQAIEDQMYVIHQFQKQYGIILDVSIHDITDSDACILSVGIDFGEIFDDAYSIDKGVKICAMGVVHKLFYESICKHLEQGFGLHVYKVDRENVRKNPNIVDFYIYKHDVTQIFINAVERESDLITREYLTGKLLGYSEESCDEYLKKAAKRQIDESNGYLGDNLNYFDLVSRCNITNVQNGYFIRSDCLSDSGQVEDEQQ